MAMNTQTEQRYIIGHLDWNTRVRFAAGLVVALLLFGSLGLMILRPWDPCGAISLQLVDSTLLTLFKVGGLLLAVVVFATIIMEARLPLFGLFAACIGIGLPIAKTAGMSYVMVRQQAGTALERPQDLWGYLILDTLAWTVVLVTLLVCSMIVEGWVKKNNNLGELEPPQSETKEKKKEDTVPPLWRGVGGMLITAVVALFFIAILAASMRRGQIIFSAIFGFYLAGLVAEQVAENDHPLWQVLAVPIVALAAYAYTWYRPDRPPGLEALLNIAPNSLARVLPVEYIFLGTIGAIFGNWTSHRMRYGKEHGE